MEICSSHRCAVTQHKCIAAMFRARCNYHSSVLLCKTGSHQAVCHSRFTYGDLLFMQVCKDIALMHCSSVQGKMQSPLFSAALQYRLTPGSLALQIHLWRFSLCSDAAQMNCSYVQGKMQLPQFSKTGSHQALCHSRCTYGDLLFRQVCKVTQHKCTAALFRARCIPNCSVLLCKICSQQAECHSRFTYGDLLFIQVCSDPAQMH